MLIYLLADAPLFKPAISFDDATVNQRSGYFYGGLLIIFVVMFFVTLKVFLPLKDKIAKRNKQADTDLIRNEIEYADYIQWCALNNEPPHVKKQIVSR